MSLAPAMNCIQFMDIRVCTQFNTHSHCTPLNIHTVTAHIHSKYKHKYATALQLSPLCAPVSTLPQRSLSATNATLLAYLHTFTHWQTHSETFSPIEHCQNSSTLTITVSESTTSVQLHSTSNQSAQQKTSKDCVPLHGSFLTRNSSRATQPPPTRTMTVLRRIRTSLSFWLAPNCHTQHRTRYACSTHCHMHVYISSRTQAGALTSVQ